MRAEIHGARIFVKAETKQDLTDLMRVLGAHPQADNYYWLVLDTSEVNTDCEITKIGDK